MISVTEIYICYTNSQEYSLHFEYSFDALAYALKKLQPFDILFDFEKQ